VRPAEWPARRLGDPEFFGTPPDYLAYYSTRFDTVEVDSTFYRCPTREAVNNWALKTPPGFIFSLKIPRTITHEKVLVDCDKEFEEFIGAAKVLGEKLGPMVFPEPQLSSVLVQVVLRSVFDDWNDDESASPWAAVSLGR
jgi:hypothetical protein